MDKKFILEFEKKVKKTIDQFDLFSGNDKVLVAASGGKDSTTCLYLLKKWGYQVEALYIDLEIGDWSKKNLANVKKFCEELGIKLNVVSVREVLGSSMCHIRAQIGAKKNLKACTVCGVIKRWLLNKKARELGASKLVTGHNLDDQAETILMNLLKNNLTLNLGQVPKTGMVENKKFVQRVKPLYFCLNKEVKKYSQMMKFPVLYEKCPCAEGVFRWKVRDWLNSLDDGVKVDVVNNFLKTLPALKKHYAGGDFVYCETCGEPSRGKICKFCELMKVLGKV